MLHTVQCMITATGLSHSYRAGDREIPILHDISLAVHAGGMVAVMGPSGSGKSTLLYCLAGLVRASAGEVDLAGRRVADLSDADLAVMRRSEVGFVFQSYNLIPTLSAFENLALPSRLARRRPDAARIEATLAAVGLEGRGASMPSQMSGGEQQRVALARVLAQEPAVVFADEPTGALDTRTGRIVMDELVRIAHAADGPQRCVLTVTHDPAVAARCDRVLFLRDGALVEELIHPAVEDVADVLTHLTGAGQEEAA